MFTFNNSSVSQSYSIKPKKDSNTNDDYVKILDDISDVNKNVLTIDVKAINLENISVELALNVLQFKNNIKIKIKRIGCKNK